MAFRSGVPAAEFYYVFIVAALCIGLILGFLLRPFILRIRSDRSKPEFQYRTLVEHAPCCIQEIDLDGRLRMINPAGVQMFGAQREDDVLHRDYFGFAAGDERTKLRRHFEEARNGVRSEFEFRTPGGRVLKSNFIPLSGAADEVTGVMSVTVDITDQKRTEQTLETSRQHLQSVLDAMDGYVGLFTPDGALVEVNKPLLAVLGLERRSIGPRPFWDLYPWDRDTSIRQEIVSAFQKAAGGEIARLDVSVTLPNNRELSVDVTFSPVLDDRGDIRQIVGSAIDVTEQRKAERMLQEGQAKLAEAQRVSKTGSWELDIATGDLTWSDEVYRIFELDKDKFEASYEAFLDVIHPEDRQLVDEAYSNSLRTGEPYQIRHRLLMADGSVKYVNERCETYLDDQGRPTRSVGTVQDVTEHAIAEKALEESEAMFRAMVESSPEGVLVTNESGEITIVNGETEELFGYSRDELLGKPVEMLVPSRIAHHAHHREKYIKHPSIRTMSKAQNLVGLRKDGTEFPVEIGLSPIVIEGRVSTVATIRDLTERRAAEAKLREAQKLESLGLLAGGIAHDFNNLLVAVIGNIDLAVQGEFRNSAAKQYLDNAVESAQTAADLCRQLLAYSGKGKFVIETVDLNEVVTAMARLLEVSIGTNCTIRYRFSSPLPGIDADLTQLRQIIMNLITNASDAIGKAQGIISVHTGSTYCDAGYLEQLSPDLKLEPGQYVYLEISDTGNGMSPETMGRIFEPFFSTKTSGRGLGLAAVMGIVRGHGGALNVYSEPGIGTTMKVFFPASKSVVSSIPADSDHLDGWQGCGTVLVIDDVESVLLVARHILEKAGFSVLTATCGRDGLALYKRHQSEIVAVLLDMTMPELSGEETFVELRKINPDVRVVLSSGYNEQDATMNFTGKGLAGFVHKPYRSIDLIRAMHAVLEPGTHDPIET